VRCKEQGGRIKCKIQEIRVEIKVKGIVKKKRKALQKRNDWNLQAIKRNQELQKDIIFHQMFFILTSHNSLLSIFLTL